MKKIFALLAAIIIVIVQCGCYDSREIDETAYIIAIGIDDAENGEFKYTFQFAAPLAISGEGGGGGGGEEEKKSEGGEEEEKNILDSKNPGVKNTVVRAADFYVARNMLNNFLSKNIDMSHLKMIVFSAGVQGDDFVQHSQLFRREREVRPHTVLAVAENSAEEFLRCVNPELEANTAKYYELMSLRSNNIYAPSKRLHEFADELSEGGSSVLPLACVSDFKDSSKLDNIGSYTQKDGWIQSDGGWISSSKSELRGMMIFRNAAAMGTMDGDSALIYNILRRDIEEFTISLENKNKYGSIVTFNVQIPAAAKYTVEQGSDGCRITVRQQLEPQYIGESLPEGYTSISELLNDFNTAVTERMESFFYSTAREFGADIMQTGNCVKQKTATLQNWSTKNWHEIYKNAEFDVVLQ